MYNYNTLEAKIRRVENIRKLRAKIACIPGKYLSYAEARDLGQYLEDIEKDLDDQIKKQQKSREAKIKEKVRIVNKTMVDNWGTRIAQKIWEEIEKCSTDEEIAQLYDLYIAPTKCQ